MLIGSNNSLTYLKPSNIWFKFLARIKRCQEVDYDEQYAFWGVRYFDVRLYVNKHNHMMIKNDTHEYPLFTFYGILDYMDKRGDVVMNVTLDASFKDHMMNSYPGVEKKFIEECHIIDSIYHNITFCGGNRKFDGKELYKFKKGGGMENRETISPAEWSPVYRFVTKWCRPLVGWFNRRYIEQFKDKHVFLVLNYVNRQIV